jgi:hypothetical protein
LFIIGPPRSGTTILYQLLLSAYRFAYLCNLDALFAPAVALSDRFSGPFKDRLPDKGDHSVYGYVPGLFAPSEAGVLFRLWFEQEGAVPEVNIRNQIDTMASRAGGPFLCKNTWNTLRIRRILTVLPNARFIWVKRDPARICDSVLRWRRSLSDSGDVWCGVRPSGWEAVRDLAPADQVRWQVDAVERAISECLAGREDRLSLVSYEALCADVPGELTRLWGAYGRETGTAWERRDWEPPEVLRRR